MMQNEEVVKEWIEKAEEDFGFASTSIEHTDYFAQICFHFQQAAEKYLKAFVTAQVQSSKVDWQIQFGIWAVKLSSFHYSSSLITAHFWQLSL